MDTFTQTFLQDRGLESFEQRLVNLGVSSVEDLSALKEQDFEKIGMLIVHIRKVQQGLAELRSPGGGSVGEYGSPGLFRAPSSEPGQLRARKSLEAWEIASSNSNETKKKNKKGFLSKFSFSKNKKGNEKQDYETSSADSSEHTYSQTSLSEMNRRSSSTTSFSGASATASISPSYTPPSSTPVAPPSHNLPPEPPAPPRGLVQAEFSNMSNVESFGNYNSTNLNLGYDPNRRPSSSASLGRPNSIASLGAVCAPPGDGFSNNSGRSASFNLGRPSGPGHVKHLSGSFNLGHGSTRGLGIGGGYQGGGSLDEKRYLQGTEYALNIRLTRVPIWDFEQSGEASTNVHAVVSLGRHDRGHVHWKRITGSAYGATSQNSTQGSSYYTGIYSAMSPLDQKTELQVTAIKATANVRASMQEVMGVLIMSDTQALCQRLSVLDGTFVHGQVLRIVSPRTSDGKEADYVYPLLPLCTITRVCHQLPDMNAPRDFLIRNHYGFHDDDGNVVGVVAMKSVDMNVEEAVARPGSEGGTTPVRGHIFEGSGFVVTPKHGNTCEVNFTLIATLSPRDLTNAKAGGRRASKVASTEQQLEAVASIVDSIRVFVDHQRNQRGDWCQGRYQPAQTQSDDPISKQLRNANSKALNRLVSEDEAIAHVPELSPRSPDSPRRQMLSSSASSQMNIDGSISSNDSAASSPPLTPPLTDLGTPISESISWTSQANVETSSPDQPSADEQVPQGLSIVPPPQTGNQNGVFLDEANDDADKLVDSDDIKILQQELAETNAKLEDVEASTRQDLEQEHKNFVDELGIMDQGDESAQDENTITALDHSVEGGSLQVETSRAEYSPIEDEEEDGLTSDEAPHHEEEEPNSAISNASSGRATPQPNSQDEAYEILRKELSAAKQRLKDLEESSKKQLEEERKKHQEILKAREREQQSGSAPSTPPANDLASNDDAIYAEMERLRARLKKVREYLPANISEEDLDLTLEEAERRMKEAVQKIMGSEDEKDQFEAQNVFEKYDQIVRNHPDYKQREIDRWRQWEDEQRPKNEAALEETKRIIKREYFNMSKEQLVNKGLKPLLAARIHSQKVLRLLFLSPEEIAKIHYGDFTNKYNPQGLDIIEQRALYAASPEEFANDPTGDKAKWRANIREKLAELVKKEESKSLRGDEVRHKAYRNDPPPSAGSGSGPRGGLGGGLPRGPGGAGKLGSGNPVAALFAGRGGPPGGGPGGTPNPVATLFAGRGGRGGGPGGRGGAVAALFAGRGGGNGLPPRGPPPSAGDVDVPEPSKIANRGAALAAMLAGRGGGGPRGPPRPLPSTAQESSGSNTEASSQDDDLASAHSSTARNSRGPLQVTDDDIKKSLERSFSSKLSLASTSSSQDAGEETPRDSLPPSRQASPPVPFQNLATSLSSSQQSGGEFETKEPSTATSPTLPVTQEAQPVKAQPDLSATPTPMGPDVAKAQPAKDSSDDELRAFLQASFTGGATQSSRPSSVSSTRSPLAAAAAPATEVPLNPPIVNAPGASASQEPAVSAAAPVAPQPPEVPAAAKKSSEDDWMASLKSSLSNEFSM